MPASIDAALGRAATDAERALAWLRIAIYSLDLVRAVWIFGHLDYGATDPSVVISLAVFAAAVGFSVVVLRRGRTLLTSRRWLLASAVLDVALCCLSLSVTVLWPGPGYAGLLALPDPYVLLLVVVVSGFRLSGRVAIASGLTAALGIQVLVSLDRRLNDALVAESMEHLTFYALLMVSAIIVAWLTAVRTRRIAWAGARDALRAERAQRDLDHLLRGHHDLSSALSAAALDSRALVRSLGDDGELSELAADLQAGVAKLADQVRGLREHAWVASGSLEQPEAHVSTVMGRLVAELQPEWPRVELAVAETPAEPLTVPGGAAVLRHVLHNLAVNACEGDGRRGARRVRLGARREADRLTLWVEDDGPGFTDAQLRRALDARGTTKRRGSGLGLMMIHRLVEQFDGALSKANRPEGGARVQVELPLVA